MALDERERADHFRLKLVKRSLEKKRESSSSRMEVDDGNNP
jgi:vacuolar-type H+-ATPase subunit D/Vma8